ncbi:hypothetical protein BDY17DRAFT_306114 [Neohortaea acidophila]|uniref:Uncharacterized protein n=1 Tax=Neohortaea acidophila TaxID=245834 RepID=A0A6A6PFV9_9PEZI|nr:uncharacterized protein BDY17DRAFT_306114 [Neohortaea acidophila]KAF2478533.1 hypothetical protein BDY17DRAFT_306114 [Neohortaea acidophila]
MAPQRQHSMQRILLSCLLLFTTIAHAGAPGKWQPAHCSSCESGGTPAKQPTCPASSPVSCSAISSDDYCCPTNNYCMWANSQVVCCPEGCDCNEQEPSSSWAPEPTTWAAPPTSTGWGPAPPTTVWHSSWHATTTWWTSTTTPSSITTTTTPCPTCSSTTTIISTTSCDECQWRPTDFDGTYCSTIFANGPNLPTTARAACGVVLVKQQTSDTVRILIGWAKMITMIVGLQVLGGMFLVWR